MSNANLKHAPKGTPATSATQKTIRKMVNELGEVEATAQLGIGRQTIGRILSGLTVARGTHALIQERLASLVKKDE